MKFLIIGCNGMAGHVISIYMKEQGHIVVGYAREKSRFVHTIIGDAADFKLLKKTILGGNYDAVINCVGICPIIWQILQKGQLYKLFI